MRTLLMMSAALVGMACGPTTNGSSEDGPGSTTDGNSTTDTGGPTATDTSADTTSGSTLGSGTSLDGSTDTGELGELLPAESAITSATCNDDGTMSVLVDAYFDVPVDSCMPPDDAPAQSQLRITIDPWDQFPGIFEASPGGVAEVTLGAESMTGTLELMVWAPGHPSVLTLDVAGESTTLQGTIDLEPCTVALGDCVPPSGG